MDTLLLERRASTAGDMANGTSRYYGSDPSGNVRLLMDGGGSVTDRVSYRAFGGAWQRAGGTATPHLFGGSVGYYQDAVKRHYVRARHYDTNTGRWMSPDPIGFAGRDRNLYRYVGNRPVNSVDPSGLWDKESVHRRLTHEIAESLYVFVRGCHYKFSVQDAKEFGNGSAALDEPYESAVNPLYWPIHFDYHDEGLRATLGPWNLLPDTRWTYFYQRREDAMAQMAARIAPGRGPQEARQTTPAFCQEGARSFGNGLHALQDMFSHADLTPAEHMTAQNRNFVDNANYDRIGSSPGIYSHDVWVNINYPTFGPKLESWFRNRPVRVFDWQYDPQRRRLARTISRTRQELCKLLREITVSSLAEQSKRSYPISFCVVCDRPKVTSRFKPFKCP